VNHLRTLHPSRSTAMMQHHNHHRAPITVEERSSRKEHARTHARTHKQHARRTLTGMKVAWVDCARASPKAVLPHPEGP
jgi:hypothetical protein